MQYIFSKTASWAVSETTASRIVDTGTEKRSLTISSGVIFGSFQAWDRKGTSICKNQVTKVMSFDAVEHTHEREIIPIHYFPAPRNCVLHYNTLSFYQIQNRAEHKNSGFRLPAILIDNITFPVNTKLKFPIIISSNDRSSVLQVIYILKVKLSVFTPIQKISKHLSSLIAALMALGVSSCVSLF